MDLEKLEKKIDTAIENVKQIQGQLEEVKGDIMTDDIVRMSGQVNWRDKDGHK